jgi:hypothetical protein
LGIEVVHNNQFPRFYQLVTRFFLATKVLFAFVAFSSRNDKIFSTSQIKQPLTHTKKIQQPQIVP